MPHKNSKNQEGYVLVSIVTFILIIATLATGSVAKTTNSEKLAGNAIQKTRSFLAADAAATLAEKMIEDMMIDRDIADTNASAGVYARDGRTVQWWRAQTTVDGVQVVDADKVLGVVEPPKFAIEYLGNYVSDGKTGVVNLDIGGSSYGRLTSDGREFLLFDVQSYGNGSYETSKTVINSTAVYAY